MSAPTRIVAGNWKLHKGPAATESFFAELLPRLPDPVAGSIAIFPPSISLTTARAALGEGGRVRLGAQNVYWEATGAFTGEISAPMAAEAGATLTLVGHSERRHVFGETDEETARKVAAVVDASLAAVLCVGETLEEREEDRAFEVVDRQLKAVLQSPDRGRPPPDSIVVAYEPVWAIGTGRTASPDDASEMHLRIRETLAAAYGPDADPIPVLYGGSVKVGNAEALLASRGIDGLLIGGASLDPVDFATICRLIA